MSRDKAEILSQRRKLRLTNEIRSKISLSKGEEKKTRESSTDRSNLSNKPVSSKGAISQKKTDPKLNESTPRVVRSKKSTVPSKTDLRSNAIEKKFTTRTNTTPKPMKTLKTTTSSSKTNLISSTSRGTKASSRDVTSSRVTKQQYFPQKFSYSAHLHEIQSNPQEIIDKKTSDSKPARIKDSKPEMNINSKPERTKDRKAEIHNPNKSEMKMNNKPVRTKIKLNDSKQIAAEKTPPKLNRERTMTRTLSPSEIKLSKIKILEETNNNEPIVRPRTATIRKHYDSQITEPPSIEIESKEAENNYEDDFESYESDFETGGSSTSDGSIATDSSSSDSESLPIELTQKRNSSGGNEEERKLDSGNYDLPDVKHKQILDKIKEAIEKENSEISKHKTGDSPNPASLSDEGFEDSYKYSLSNSGFINFTDAKKKLERRNPKSRKRGDDLMNMIRLNAVSFSLFDMNPVSYDEFMQSFGRAGTIQMSAQTGDDDLDEQIQSELIETQEKWTQYPIRFPKTEHEHESQIETVCKPHQEGSTTFQNISKFMSSYGKLILHILEQKSSKKLLHIDKNKREIPFSNGHFKLNYDQTPFLNSRAVVFLTHSKYGALLTVHASDMQNHLNHSEQLLKRSTICVWNVLKPNIPQKLLSSYGEITKACFDSSHGYLVFAGINDGAISVWDLRESSTFHRHIRDETLDKSYIMRSATYTTRIVLAMKEFTAIIVAIQSLPTDASVHADQMSAIQICTLDEIGTVIIWSVIQKRATPELRSDDQGLVPWGRVILVQGLVVSLQKMNPNLKELHCFGMTFSEMEPNDLYITSNYGVLHCLSSGMKPKIKLYTNDKSSTLCVEMAPFSATHILSGCANGNIHLYSRLYEKPLMTLRNTDEKTNQSAIERIEWSNCRPCVFFIKDSANVIQVWDLTASDMYPIYSIPFSENVTDIKCSPILPKQSTEPHYMAIATTTGEVVLHVLNNEYTDQNKKERIQFFNYVNRL